MQRHEAEKATLHIPITDLYGTPAPRPLAPGAAEGFQGVEDVGQAFFQGPLPLKPASMADRGSGAGAAASSWRRRGPARAGGGPGLGRGGGRGARMGGGVSAGIRAWEAGGAPVGYFHASIGLFLCVEGSEGGPIQESLGGGPAARAAAASALGAARRVRKSGRSQRMVPAASSAARRASRRPGARDGLGPDGARGLVRPGHGAEVAPAEAVSMAASNSREAAQHADRALLVQDLSLGEVLAATQFVEHV